MREKTTPRFPREFTRIDWDAFGGASPLPSGNEPYIAEPGDEIAIILSGNEGKPDDASCSLQVMIPDTMDGDFIAYECVFPTETAGMLAMVEMIDLIARGKHGDFNKPDDFACFVDKAAMLATFDYEWRQRNNARDSITRIC